MPLPSSGQGPAGRDHQAAHAARRVRRRISGLCGAVEPAAAGRQGGPDLLSDGEALLYTTRETRSYVFAVTRTGAAWKQIPLGTTALSEKVAAFRRGLDVEALRQSAAGGKPVLFDLGLANELYVSLLGPVEDLIKDARHVLVVPSGPLTRCRFTCL